VRNQSVHPARQNESDNPGTVENNSLVISLGFGHVGFEILRFTVLAHPSRLENYFNLACINRKYITLPINTSATIYYRSNDPDLSCDVG
jgi:hypothetical protein